MMTSTSPAISTTSTTTSKSTFAINPTVTPSSSLNSALTSLIPSYLPTVFTNRAFEVGSAGIRCSILEAFPSLSHWVADSHSGQFDRANLAGLLNWAYEQGVSDGRSRLDGLQVGSVNSVNTTQNSSTIHQAYALGFAQGVQDQQEYSAWLDENEPRLREEEEMSEAVQGGIWMGWDANVDGVRVRGFVS